MIKKFNYGILVVFIVAYVLVVYNGSLYQNIYIMIYDEISSK